MSEYRLIIHPRDVDLVEIMQGGIDKPQYGMIEIVTDHPGYLASLIEQALTGIAPTYYPLVVEQKESA